MHNVSVLAAGEGRSGTDALLPHLPELVFGLIAFGIVLFVASKFFVPAMEKAYAERRDAIEGGMARAEQAEAEAEAARQKYESQLAEARAEANAVRDKAREEGDAIREEKRQQAEVEAARVLDTAQKQIAAERQQAQVELRGEVGRLSTDLAGRIVGESLEDETRQKGLVDRFLAELESGKATGADSAGVR
ncbi:ATP synthase F0 subcomplex B subunit [Kytococcus aerolatus]|uniref:ATP synthase subunit b n=1 Tax=Kytococcus aerolatus TaxID=592308 RepID=A0A212T654_9MICO|nr:F0F1 ATP synthase subunit B [Kytococcus aerolatus]SNC61537.1 ATP synthase F0 subcomplex B subunit [Kytococcus aerolatus]